MDRFASADPAVWELVVQLPRDPTRAGARQLTRTAHGTERDAQRALATLVSEVSAGRFVATPATFGELLDRWLEHVDDHLSPTTVRSVATADAAAGDPAAAGHWRTTFSDTAVGTFAGRSSGTLCR